MPYELIRGLQVVDQELYSQYRNAIRPLLEETGSGFRYDFDVARVLRGAEGSAEVNRVFVVQFPDKATKERFFADPRYIEIRSRLFDPAVRTRVTIAEYPSDDGVPLP